MTPEDDTILRREDGSIDPAPNLRRARDLRNARLRRAFARLALRRDVPARAAAEDPAAVPAGD